MEKFNYKNLKTVGSHGAAMMMFALFVFFLSMTIIVGISKPAVREYTLAKLAFESKQAYFLAESGAEDALYRINNSMQIDGSENLVSGNTTISTTITDLSGGDKDILSLSSAYQRKVNLLLAQGVGASFNYGMQSGTGGVTMNNNSSVIGNLYSNGPIIGTGSASITGGAVSANGQAATVDQSFGSGTPASNNIFGNATTTEDVAQSFQLSATNYVTSAQVYIKKVGNPANATVTIRSNSSGKPGTVRATGTLSSSLVSTNYGWVNITFTNYQATAGTTYWLTIDSASSAANYYVIGGGTGYTSGTANIGRASTSTWSQLGVNTDLFFSVSTGGILGSISGVTVGTGGIGNAEAHSVTGSNVAGTIYCQTGSGNNKLCNTSHPDPVPANFPISDQNITDWKAEALAGGTSSGINLSGSMTQSVGPRQITGNVTLSSSSVLTVNGILWITGNVSINNSSIIKLASSFGASGGIIIVDGTVSTNNSAVFQGSGTVGSYMMVVSTNTSNSAITINNTAGSIIIVAPYGGVQMNNSAGANQVTAKSITLNNNATITYDSGLASASFSTGPSGSWNVKSWKETQ